MGGSNRISTGTVLEILGPTGVGKSAMAVELAREFGGEVISADSMQVYTGFDIGTAKIAPEEMGGIRHYGIDIYDADEQSTAYRFMENAWRWCGEIIEKGRLPVICGGTALYLRILQQGVFPETSENRKTRAVLKEKLLRVGLDNLWSELNEIDPEYAGKIGKNDEKRILRALEIMQNTGLPPTQAFELNQTPFSGTRFIRIGLNMDRADLYKRIEDRVDRMIQQGLVEETRRLKELYPAGAPPFQGVGYREISSYLQGEFNLHEAVSLIKQHTRNFAKRQLSWWRQEKDIHWFEPSQIEAVRELVRKELSR